MQFFIFELKYDNLYNFYRYYFECIITLDFNVIRNRVNTGFVKGWDVVHVDKCLPNQWFL